MTLDVALAAGVAITDTLLLNMRWPYRTPGLITIASIAVAVGLLPMPYGYYMLLRLFFCGVSLYYVTRPSGVRDVEKWVLVGLAVLYNPLVPVELGSKPLWSIVNIGTVVYFWVLSRRATGTSYG